MSFSALVEELAKPEYATLTDSEAAAAINAKTVDIRRLVSTWEIKQHAIENGYWATLVMYRESDQTPSQVKGLAISVLDWIDDISGKITQADLDRPTVQAMISGLVAAGIATQQHADQLDALADQTIAWTQHVGLGEVGIGLVQNARKEL